MRACQKCAAPIPTAAKVCPLCGREQLTNVGLKSQTVPVMEDVTEEMQQRDQEVGRIALMSLVSGSALAALVTGLSVSDFLVGAGSFFVALITLFTAIQALGIDVGM